MGEDRGIEAKRLKDLLIGLFMETMCKVFEDLCFNKNSFFGTLIILYSNFTVTVLYSAFAFHLYILSSFKCEYSSSDTVTYSFF